MALRELSEVMPEPAADLSADQALLDQLLNFEKPGAETGGGEEGFDLGSQILCKVWIECERCTTVSSRFASENPMD